MAKSKAQEKVAKTRTKPKTSKNLQLPINFIIITASMAVAVWFGYKGYLETRVNTPYDAKKACNLSFNNLTLYILLYKPLLVIQDTKSKISNNRIIQNCRLNCLISLKFSVSFNVREFVIVNLISAEINLGDIRDVMYSYTFTVYIQYLQTPAGLISSTRILFEN